MLPKKVCSKPLKTMLRLCKICSMQKPYNNTAVYRSKASGFHGSRCWDCWLVHSALSMAIRYAQPHTQAQQKASARTWRQQNPSSNTANVRQYRLAKLKRIPLWADRKAIREVYKQAAQQGLTVDHIYPLRGKLVSGLHVANNLQLLTQTENARKGNKMPCV